MSSVGVISVDDGRHEQALAEPFQSSVNGHTNGHALRTWHQKLVQRLCSFWVRVAISAFWVVLAIAGLAVFKQFQQALESEVPPCAGTPSALAHNTFNRYFPATPLNGAFLIESRDGTKLLDFVNRSTCEIEFDPPLFPPNMKNTTDVVTVVCKARDLSALGGGCLLSRDVEPQLEKLVNQVGEQFLPIFMNESKVNQTIDMIIKYLRSKTADAMKGLPNVTSCPVATSLTQEWLSFTGKLEGQLNATFPMYNSKELSLTSIPNMTIPKSVELPAAITDMLKNKTKGMIDIERLNISVVVPSGQFWELFSNKLLADSFTTSLVSISVSDPDPSVMIVPTSPIAKNIGTYMDTLAADAPQSLNARASSMGSIFYYVKQGIDKTMDMSAKTVPIALLILAGMVRNLRLLLIVIPNLIITILAAVLIMYPIALSMTTATTAPSLMVAVALAMSIDYSLFLLTRFRKEIAAERPVPDAVAIMLATSGRIVLVSGTTLLLCFLTMLSLPVAFIYSMGIAAAITVLVAVTVSLTFTPVLLLSCPQFFSSDRYFGFNTDGCCCSSSARAPSMADEEALPHQPSREEQDARVESEEANVISKSCWPRFGTQIQMGAWFVAIALVAVMIPVAVTSLPKFQHSVGILPMMQTDSPSTDTLITLQNAFGVGAVFPTQMIVEAPAGATSGDNLPKWLQSVCDELSHIADDVNSNLDSSLPPFTSRVFSGVMILDGQCQTGGAGSFGKWNTAGPPHTVTVVSISYQIDPFSPQGLQWIQAMRDAVSTDRAKSVASWYIDGTGPIQMDASNLTFARLPLMVGLMMSVVFVVMAISFRSIVAPIRAVFCLTWMLVVTYGLAIYTFQNGAFSFLNWSQLGQRESGAMSWLSPSMAGAMMVGLGLDYDIFYSERVVEEWEHGYKEQEAAARALGATANTITAAGIIMVVAFLALLVSTTPVLNEIAFLLIVSVIIDCFITTKIIIPCSMALLGKFNFWPRKQPVSPAQC